MWHWQLPWVHTTYFLFVIFLFFWQLLNKLDTKLPDTLRLHLCTLIFMLFTSVAFIIIYFLVTMVSKVMYVHMVTFATKNLMLFIPLCIQFYIIKY